jgi:pyrophosphate--fructose-6-phosphate 1-phosphotransferase
MLIVHEVMGRNCGWLTAATALEYRNLIDHDDYLPELGLSFDRRDVHVSTSPRWRLTWKKRLRGYGM